MILNVLRTKRSGCKPSVKMPSRRGVSARLIAFARKIRKDEDRFFQSLAAQWSEAENGQRSSEVLLREASNNPNVRMLQGGYYMGTVIPRGLSPSDGRTWFTRKPLPGYTM